MRKSIESDGVFEPASAALKKVLKFDSAGRFAEGSRSSSADSLRRHEKVLVLTLRFRFADTIKKVLVLTPRFVSLAGRMACSTSLLAAATFQVGAAV